MPYMGSFPAFRLRRVLMCLLPQILIATSVLSAAPHQAASETPHAAAISAGRDTFHQFCAPCHGQDAKGKGPIASDLVTQPTDLTQTGRRHKGVFPLDTLERMLKSTDASMLPAHRGQGQMPTWGPVFLSVDSTPALALVRVANLLAYLESIQR